MTARPHTSSRRLGALVAATAMALSVLAGYALPSWAAPPSNDNIANATVLDISGLASAPVTSTSERLEATTEADEHRVGCSNVQTAWWVIKPTADTYVHADTAGSGSAQYMAVYRYPGFSTPDFSELSEQPGAGCTWGSDNHTDWLAEAGRTYYVRVSSSSTLTDAAAATTKLNLRTIRSDVSAHALSAIPQPVTAGEPMTYSLQTHNASGTDDAFGVTVATELSEDVTYSHAGGHRSETCVLSGASAGGSGGTVTCSNERLGNGGIWYLDLVVTTRTANADLQATMTTSSTTADADSTNDSRVLSSVVTQPAPPANDDLADATTIDATALPLELTYDRRDATMEEGESAASHVDDQSAWWTVESAEGRFLHVELNGDQYNSRGISVYAFDGDPAAPTFADLTMIGNNATYYNGGGDLSWALEPGRRYYVQVGTNGGRLTNLDYTETTLSIRDSVSDVAIHQNVDTPDPVTTEQNLRYELIARNLSGDDNAFGVQLVQTLPSNVTFKAMDYNNYSGSSTCTHGGAAADGSGGTVTCTMNALPPGAYWYAYMDTTATSGSGTGTAQASATITSVSPDTDDANNTMTSDTTINEPNPPVNDHLADATTIDLAALPAALTFDRLDATMEEGEPTASHVDAQSAWWKVTAPEGGYLHVELNGDQYNSRGISVYSFSGDPAAPTFADLAMIGNNATYYNGGGDLSWALEAGETYYVQVGTNGGRQGSSDYTETILNVRHSVSDVGIAQNVDTPDPVTTDQNLRYELIAHNVNGEEQAFGVQLVQTLPPNVTYKEMHYNNYAGSSTCAHAGAAADGSGGTVTCTMNALPPGAHWYAYIDTTATSGSGEGTAQASATVTSASPDSSDANNTMTADTTIKEPNPPANDHLADATTIDLAALPAALTFDRLDATMEEGEPTGSHVDQQSAWWKVTAPDGGYLHTELSGDQYNSRGMALYVDNRLLPLDLGLELTDVTFSDLTMIGNNATYYNGGADLSWHLEPGRTYYVQVGTNGVRQGDSNYTETTLNVRTSVSDVTMYDLTDYPDVVKVGDPLQYRLTGRNAAGEDNAFGITMTDVLSDDVVFSGVSYNSAGTGSTCTHTGANEDGSGGVVTCTRNAMHGGEHWTVYLDVVGLRSGFASNTASISSTSPDSDTTNGTKDLSSKLTAPNSELSLVMASPESPVVVGTDTTYVATLTNAGPHNSPSTLVTWTLADGLTPMSASVPDGSCQINGQLVTCTLGWVYVDDAPAVTLVARATEPGSKAVTAAVSADVDQAVSSDDTVIASTLFQDPPAAQDSAWAGTEDVPVDVILSAVDRDTAPADLTFVIVTPPAHGTLQGTGVVSEETVVSGTPEAGEAPAQAVLGLTYVPTANDNSVVWDGPDTFSYKVRDTDGHESAVVTASLTLAAVNDAPVAADDQMRTLEDMATAPLDVLGNDTDVDLTREGDELSVTVVEQAAHGTVVCSTAGSCVYTPSANTNGTDSFTYKVTDRHNAVSTATVSITVDAVNDAPVTAADTATTDEDTALDIDVLANDVDVDLQHEGDAHTLVVTEGPSAGTAVINDEGKFRYTPDLHANSSFQESPSTDTFTYTWTDEAGEQSTSTVTVTVAPVNDAPVAEADSATTDEDNATAVIDVLANDGDVDLTREGDVLTVAVGTQPAHGTVVCGAAGDCVYSPEQHWNGTDSFTYVVSDRAGAQDSETVTVTVRPVNDAPVAVDDAATLAEDGSVVLPVLTNDSDVDLSRETDTQAVAVTTQPENGVAVVGADNAITYTPAANWNGTERFSYTYTDRAGLADVADVVLTVTPVNDAPVALTRDVTTAEDTASTPFDLLADDLDVDTGYEGDTLTVEVTEAPTHGTLTCIAGTACTYTPDADFNGTDRASYSVTDAAGLSDASTVEIVVTAVNDAPVAQPVGAATDEDVPVALTLVGSDVDGDALTYSVATQPAHGSVDCTAMSCLYTPVADYNGADSFTYGVSDGTVMTTETASIAVAAVNDAPVALDTTLAVSQDSDTATVTIGGTDVDGDALTYEATEAGHGTVVCDGATCGYKPDAGYSGADHFGFLVTDPSGASDHGVVAVTVQEAGYVEPDPTPTADPSASASPTASASASPTATASAAPVVEPPPVQPPPVVDNPVPTLPSPTASPSGPTPTPLDMDTATSTAPDGTATARSTDGARTVVEATAQGAGTLIVGRFDENPVEAATFDASGSYFDVYVEPGSEFRSLVIRTCELNGGTALRWWDPTGDGTWREVSDATYTAGPPACIEAIVDDTTSPSLDDLTGTVFAVENGASGLYTAVVPSRVYDSRKAADGAVAAGADRKVAVLGKGGVPARGVSAVVVNLTGVGATEVADVQVYPTGDRPARRTSNLNVRPGPAVADLVTTPVGDDGTISLSTSSGATHLAVDVVGWYGDGSVAGGSSFRSLTPSRVFDSRTMQTPVAAGRDRAVAVTGRNGVPAGGVDAVVVNTTVVGSTAATDVQLYPTGSQPAVRTSNVNVPNAAARANLAVVKVGEDGRISLSTSSGTTHVVLDVVGWYGARTAADPGLRFTPVTPVRMYDSRVADGGVVAGTDRVVPVGGFKGIPVGAEAVVTTATVVGADRPTDVQLFPTGDRPERRTSNVNVTTGAAVPNQVVVGLGSGGAISVSSSAGAPHVVLDAVGYFVE